MEFRNYSKSKVVSFRKTKEEFGGLSNMASGYPIDIQGVRILSSEALYQAMRFPEHPEIQIKIINQRSPMTAKMISKKYRQDTRRDWEKERLVIMRWCLRVKLIQNWDKFGALLLSTNNKIIVENSHKDLFWGAVEKKQNELVGTNALGRLLMELREELPSYIKRDELLPPKIEDFKLLGKEIESIKFTIDRMPIVKDKKPTVETENLKWSLFDNRN